MSEQPPKGRGRYGVRPEYDPERVPSAEPDRAPPHSAEAEEHVIACCLLDGDHTVARCMVAGVVPESFYFPANRLLFEIITKLREAGRLVSLETLAEELKQSRQLEAVGGFAYLMQVTGKIPTTAHAGYFIDKVLEKQRLREVVRAASAAVEGAYAYTGGGLSEYEPLARAVDALQRVRSKGGSNLPPITGWMDLLGETMAPPPELVAGLLHRGAKMMLGGGSKSMKTWALMDLAISVSTGTPFWGMATVKAPVLYVNYELMPYFFRERGKEIFEAKHIGKPEDALLTTWHLRGRACDLREQIPLFVSRCAGSEYGLIILDPIYKALGDRDENANGEVAALLNEVEALTVKTGAAVAFGHHFSKGNQSEKAAQDRVSGAGAWARDPDTLVTMTNHAEEGAFAVDFILRNHKPKASLVVRWEHPCMRLDAGLDPAALRTPGRPKETNANQVLVLLIGRSLSYNDWKRACIDKGITESTAKRRIDEAVNAGSAVHCRDGKYRVRAEAAPEDIKK